MCSTRSLPDSACRAASGRCGSGRRASRALPKGRCRHRGSRATRGPSPGRRSCRKSWSSPRDCPALNQRSCGDRLKIGHSAGAIAGNRGTNRAGAENASLRLLADVSSRQMNPSVLDGYDPQGFYCEMLQQRGEPGGQGAPFRPVDCGAEAARAAMPTPSSTISGSPLRFIRTPRRSTGSCRSM